MIKIRSIADIEILSETVNLECKLAVGRDGRGQLPKDFWPTYSAFANTHGGIILLGIKEKQGRFSLHGITDPQRITTDLFNVINNPQKVSVNLLTDQHISIITLDGKTFVQVEVPAANRKQKPVFLNGNPFQKNTYRRLHEGDRPCDDETVKRMLAEQVEDERDTRILSGFGMEDVNTESLLVYRQMLRDAKPGHPWLELEDKDFLKRLKGWRQDRQSGEEGLTMAGLLMFGHWDAIQDGVPHYFVDYQERPEARAGLRWMDRLIPDGTWSGNVFDFYRRVYRKLITDLKVPFALKDGQRREDTPVHEAIREALVNALVHADYSGRLSVLVVKRPDMFGFRNPGNMRIPVLQAIHGGESDCRNRLIHQMFLMIGLGERAGSGVPKIYSGWESQDWRPPALYEKDEPEQTLLELRMLDLLPPDVMDTLKKRFKDENFNSLNRQERLILATAAIEGVVSHPRLMEISIDHPHDLTLALQKLVKTGYLDSSGHGRGTVYHIPGVELPTPDEVFAGDAMVETLKPSDLNSEGLPESSEGLVKSSEGLPESSEGLQYEGLECRIIHVLDGLKTQLRNELEEIAGPAKASRKLQKQEMSDLICSLCNGHYLGLKVLAALLDRSENYLRQSQLNPLVEQGRLRRAFPTTPNDPRQAYTSSKQ
ncbi:MAG: putative DNA binding domain-containing protein [Desulfobacterium sp.]|nr:putative DNA binding domain-containing protein [Desulfobacterium sp.]